MDDYALAVSIKSVKGLPVESAAYVKCSVTRTSKFFRTEWAEEPSKDIEFDDNKFYFYEVKYEDLIEFQVNDVHPRKDLNLGVATLEVEKINGTQSMKLKLEGLEGEETGELDIEVEYRGKKKEDETDDDGFMMMAEVSGASKGEETTSGMAGRPRRGRNRKVFKPHTPPELKTRINRGKIKESRYPPFMNTLVFEPRGVDHKRDPHPEYKLDLEFIYGSSKKGCRGDILFVNSEGDLVYPAAACTVVYNPEKHTQRILRGHRDDLVCMAQHPNKDIFATGETGKDDYILIHDTTTGECLKQLASHLIFKPGGNLALSFSPDGKLLAAVGGTREKATLVVYKWEKGKLLYKKPLDTKNTYALEFSPDGRTMVWCGNKSIKFIDAESGKIRNGIVSSKGGKLQPFYCCKFDQKGNAMVGTHSGMLYFFGGNSMIGKQKVHKGAIRSITLTGDGGFITSGKDGNINFFNKDKELTKTLPMGDYTRGVAVRDENTLYVFETDGDVIEVKIEEETAKHLLIGHSGARAELWGLATVPNSNLFVSAGDDGRVLLFDKSTRKLVGQIKNPGKQFRGVAVSPDGEHVAVSTIKGKVYIMELKELAKSGGKPIKSIDTSKKTAQEVAVLSYSPDGNYLAVGSHDTTVYIYAAKHNYKLVKRFKDHSSSILALDWTLDSKGMRTCCRAYELLHWYVGKGNWQRDLVSSDDNPDWRWATQTCLLGWEVRGAWKMHIYNDGTDINSMAVRFDKNEEGGEVRGLLATSDDFGMVNLFSYPTLKVKAPMDSYGGHCSHTTNVRFSDDGKHLLSAGGGDLTVFQWKVVKK